MFTVIKGHKSLLQDALCNYQTALLLPITLLTSIISSQDFH